MPLITIAKAIAEDFTNGTQRLSAITGFLNLTIILSLWQERLGIAPVALFGSSFGAYIVIIYIVGHVDRQIKEKVILKDSDKN